MCRQERSAGQKDVDPAVELCVGDALEDLFGRKEAQGKSTPASNTCRLGGSFCVLCAGRKEALLSFVWI